MLAEHEATVTCVAVTDSNQRALSGSADCCVMYACTMNETRVHRGEARNLTCCTRIMYSIWDISTGAATQKLTGHTGTVTQVRTTEDGTQAVLSCAPANASYSDTDTHVTVESLSSPTRSVSLCAVSLDCTVRAWCLQSGAPLITFCVGRPVLQAMCTFDASRIALRLAHCTQPVFLSLRHLIAAGLPSPKASTSAAAPNASAGAKPPPNAEGASSGESGGSTSLTSSSSIRGRPVGTLPVRKLQRSLTVPANVLGE